MVVNKIILGSVAFGVSFSLGLLASQDLGKALLSGIVTVPAAYAGAAIADNRRVKHERLIRSSFEEQIHALETHQVQLHQSISVATATRQEVGATIDALQNQHGELVNQVSEIQQQRAQLNHDLVNLQREKQEIQRQSDSLQTQVQAL